MHPRDIVLLLPNIRSCHNVGAMFRTADACAVSRLFLLGYTPAPPKPQIDKVSLGAEQWVPWETSESLLHVIHALKEQGYIIVGLEKTTDSIAMSHFKSTLPNTAPIALIVGNEVDGLDDETFAQCDYVVHIPMLGKKESLNVSIAAGIALYELRHG